MNNYRVWTGGIIWLVLLIGFFVFFSTGPEKNKRPAVASEIGQYVFGQRKIVELNFDSPQIIRYGDPIFLEQGGDSIRIGEIARVGSRDSTKSKPIETNLAYARFYSSAPILQSSDTLVYHSTPREIGWVVKMMLPSETRKKIGQLITEAYVDHQQEIVQNLRPVIEAAMREAIPVIESDLRAAFARREGRWKKIGERYREEIVEKDLIPLIEEYIWPIVREESRPLSEEIGKEIWNKASLMRFGWRVIYDATPLPKRDLTKKEFERFVETEGFPIIQDHMDDLIRLQQKILTRISNNTKVRNVVGKSLMKIVDDKEVQQLVVEIVEEVFIKNQKLVDIFQRHWDSDQGRAAMQITGERLEPTIAAIGEELFGNPTKVITPEFARVLRFKILKKDARWLVLNPSTSATPDKPLAIKRLNVVAAPTSTENPFHINRD